MARTDHTNVDLSDVLWSTVGSVRSTWPDEARDLTPWVIDRLAELGEKLGLTLKYIDREVRLGDFRADIVAEDDAGRMVVIENQFGPSDHGHFGQLVLYACEAQADVAVWLVADPFGIRTEHCAALRRLNKVFADQIDFYGVQLEVSSEPVPLGKPAGPVLPRLNVFVRPDDDSCAALT